MKKLFTLLLLLTVNSIAVAQGDSSPNSYSISEMAELIGKSGCTKFQDEDEYRDCFSKYLDQQKDSNSQLQDDSEASPTAERIVAMRCAKSGRTRVICGAGLALANLWPFGWLVITALVGAGVVAFRRKATRT